MCVCDCTHLDRNKSTTTRQSTDTRKMLIDWRWFLCSDGHPDFGAPCCLFFSVEWEERVYNTGTDFYTNNCRNKTIDNFFLGFFGFFFFLFSQAPHTHTRHTVPLRRVSRFIRFCYFVVLLFNKRTRRGAHLAKYCSTIATDKTYIRSVSMHHYYRQHGQHNLSLSLSLCLLCVDVPPRARSKTKCTFSKHAQTQPKPMRQGFCGFVVVVIWFMLTHTHTRARLMPIARHSHIPEFVQGTRKVIGETGMTSLLLMLAAI